MAEVKLENLTKKFGEVVAAKSINLEITDGVFQVLLGPSGCGKTTILRLIAGLEDPTEGKVYIDGKDVTNLSPKDRDIAMVFQTYSLYPHMTVYDNIAFPLRIRRINKKELDKRVVKVATLLGLENMLHKKPRELSGGQRQRVAMGRAIIREPKVFLFDEPLSNLDAKLRVQMRAELAALHKKLGVTSVYVTHDQVEAMTLGDRIAVINNGEIQDVGKPMEIYKKPKNLFVAGFIGSPPMNLIEGEIKGGIFTSEDISFPVKDTSIFGKVTIGIRPEKIKIVKNNGVEGEVEVVETIGGESILYVKTGKRRIIIRTFDSKQYSLGDKVMYIFDPYALHFFNTETGLRI